MPGVIGVSSTSDQDVNGLLSGIQWNTTSLTYSFPTSAAYYGSQYGNGEPSNNFQPLNATQQAAVRTVLGLYSSFTGLTFTEVTESASAHADLRFAQSNAPSTAWGYFPNPAGEGGDSWYNYSTGYYASPVRGNYAWTTFIHEIGHTLGLEHGHDPSNPYGAMTATHDSMEYSVMTYRSYEGASTTSGYTNETWGYAQTPMMYDIAALQDMYGANFNSNSGNTVYTWNAATGQEFLNGVGQGAPGGNRIFATVWDGGGNDTYDFSNYTTGLKVSLRPGEWTTTSTAELAKLYYTGSVVADGNIANALLYHGDQRSMIENANGGSGADVMVGNFLNNTLKGNGGNDDIWGLEGDDILDGGAGNDNLVGGDGIDSIRLHGNHTQFLISRIGNGTYRVVDQRSGSPDGTDTFSTIEQFIFDDGAYQLGDMFGSAPVVAINDHSLHMNQWTQLTGWITYSDPDGDPATTYEFRDDGSGAASGFFWTPDNGHHAAGASFTVAASNLSTVWLRGGQTTGAETISVRVFDGIDWSAWDTFNLTTTNTAPVATINDHGVRTSQWAQLSNWITSSDPDGDAITRYQIIDGGTGASSGYVWSPTNAHYAAGTPFDVLASDIGSVWLRGGQATGTETISIRAFDGSDWGAWDTFTFTTQPNTAPVAAINDHGLRVNAWSQLTGWVAASDADGDAITRYQVLDGGGAADSAYFWTPDNAHHAAGTPFEIAASDLASLWLRGGQALGSETVSIRAFDGTDWGAWDTFTFTTQANNAPVATINDHGLRVNEWARLGNWVSTTDADGDAVTRYQIIDGGTGASSAYFWTPDNAHRAAGTPFEVSAADLANVWVRGGQSLGSETMSIRAFDGTDWGAWDTFTFTTQVNAAPAAAANDHTLHVNEWSQLTGWISATDADGDAVTGGTGASSGYFWSADDAHHAANTPFEVAASDVAGVWLRGGLSLGTETISVRVFDGTDWSGWGTFTLTTIA